ncbi:hypothetical protein C3L57_08525, partial [Veillonellaceae bacterium M2-8]|nr:hypothetical protein [Veillonellaceae bacterium M2-8]
MVVLWRVFAEWAEESHVDSIEGAAEPLIVDGELDSMAVDAVHDFALKPVIDWADLVVFGFHDAMSSEACSADDAIG